MPASFTTTNSSSATGRPATLRPPATARTSALSTSRLPLRTILRRIRANPRLVLAVLPLLPASFIFIYALTLLYRTPQLPITPSAPEPFSVGLSRVNITPSEPVFLSGFATRTSAPAHAHLLDPSIPLLARVLALQASSTTLVLVSLDLIALPRSLSKTIYDTLYSRHGLSRSQVRLCVTHTHSGPVVADALSPLSPTSAADQAAITRYATFLSDAIIRAVVRAVDTARSLKVSTSYPHLHSARDTAVLAVNRREIPESSFSVDGKRGHIDNSVPLLALRTGSSPKSKLLAAVFSYSAHATVLTSGMAYSPDYPGVAAHLLENKYPGASFLFLAGCGGDVNIYPRGTSSLLSQHAKTLTASVERALAVARPISASTTLARLQTERQVVRLPFAKRYTAHELRHRAQGSEAERRAVSVLEKRLGADGVTAAYYDFPVTTWRIDGVTLAFLAGEPTVGYATRLRAVGADWTVGYSEEVMGYVGTADVISAGGREGGERAAWYYGLPAAWRPEVEELIVDAVNATISAVRYVSTGNTAQEIER